MGYQTRDVSYKELRYIFSDILRTRHVEDVSSAIPIRKKIKSLLYIVFPQQSRRKQSVAFYVRRTHCMHYLPRRAGCAYQSSLRYRCAFAHVGVEYRECVSVRERVYPRSHVCTRMFYLFCQINIFLLRGEGWTRFFSPPTDIFFPVFRDIGLLNLSEIGMRTQTQPYVKLCATGVCPMPSWWKVEPRKWTAATSGTGWIYTRRLSPVVVTIARGRSSSATPLDPDLESRSIILATVNAAGLSEQSLAYIIYRCLQVYGSQTIS